MDGIYPSNSKDCACLKPAFHAFTTASHGETVMERQILPFKHPLLLPYTSIMGPVSPPGHCHLQVHPHPKAQGALAEGQQLGVQGGLGPSYPPSSRTGGCIPVMAGVFPSGGEDISG